jgi:hypothetical protein
MKKFAKVLHFFSLDCRLLEFFKYSTYELSSKHKMYTVLPAFFGDRFGGKDCGLCTNNPPAEEVG